MTQAEKDKILKMFNEILEMGDDVTEQERNIKDLDQQKSCEAPLYKDDGDVIQTPGDEEDTPKEAQKVDAQFQGRNSSVETKKCDNMDSLCGSSGLDDPREAWPFVRRFPL